MGVRDHGRPRPRPSRASRAAWRPRPRGGTEAKATSLPLKIICLEDDSFPEIWGKKRPILRGESGSFGGSCHIFLFLQKLTRMTPK